MNTTIIEQKKMTPEQFCYWLQGYVEISVDSFPSKSEWEVITEHLKMVCRKEIPQFHMPDPPIFFY